MDPAQPEPPPEVLEYDLKGFPSRVVRSGPTRVLVQTGVPAAKALRRQLDKRLYDPTNEPAGSGR